MVIITTGSHRSSSHACSYIVIILIIFLVSILLISWQRSSPWRWRKACSWSCPPPLPWGDLACPCGLPVGCALRACVPRCAGMRGVGPVRALAPTGGSEQLLAASQPEGAVGFVPRFDQREPWGFVPCFNERKL